ncbi:MAG: hypothetical protein KGL79_08915 [Acidobacteriota bacterium]|nr:hypothetical protein [Acidobacteriota bacterium]
MSTFEDASPLDVARRAFLRFSPEQVLAVVDELDLRAHTKITAVIGVPLKRLQQSRDVTAFAVGAPAAAIKALLELVSGAPLEKVVDALGEHAESPSYDQLATVLDQLVAAGTSDDDVVAVLAVAVSEGFPAAPHCRQLLSERAAWQLPALPEREASSIASPRSPRPEIKELRKARREAQKSKKKPVSPPRPVKTKRANEPVTTPTASSATPVVVPPLERRRYLFTPRELERFDADHALVGTVVVVDVPFDAIDPDQPEVHAKARPALVVAGSDEELLVRALYSQPSPTRALFAPWRRLNLDHPSYLDVTRVEVKSRDVTGPSLGTVTTEEWNELF